MSKASEIRVFGMGDQGVHLSVGPLHSETGDLTQAQNASFLGADARGGLASRMGLAVFSAACAGAIHAILSVTFTDTVTTTLLTDDNGEILTDDALVALSEG
jgi:hypothetical protein